MEMSEVTRSVMEVFIWRRILVVFSCFLIFAAFVLTGTLVGWGEQPASIEAKEIGIEFSIPPVTDQLTAIGAKNRDQLIEYLQCRELLYGALEEGKPKVRIVLKDWGGSKDAAGDSVVAIYQTYADIPYHSVKVDCPKSKYPIRECWFIKYEDEFDGS